MGMMFLLFASGIFWDVNLITDLHSRALLMTFNPIAFLIDAYRQILMYDSHYDLPHLLVLGGIISSALLIMHIILHKASKAISAKVLS